jgi:hypothetical protein
VVIDYDEADKNCSEFLREWELANAGDPSLRKNYLDMNKETMQNWQLIRKKKLKQLRESISMRISQAKERKEYIEEENRIKLQISNMKWDAIKY